LISLLAAESDLLSVGRRVCGRVRRDLGLSARQHLLRPDGDATMGVSRPENDLVPAESRSSFGALGTEKLTHLNCLIGVQPCL